MELWRRLRSRRQRRVTRAVRNFSTQPKYPIVARAKLLHGGARLVLVCVCVALSTVSRFIILTNFISQRMWPQAKSHLKITICSILARLEALGWFALSYHSLDMYTFHRVLSCSFSVGYSVKEPCVSLPNCEASKLTQSTMYSSPSCRQSHAHRNGTTHSPHLPSPEGDTTWLKEWETIDVRGRSKVPERFLAISYMWM